jgi:TetR/AcrR family transcriptional repressor of nem operon
MPRPRGFEEGDVLDRAMALFWAKGFEAATLDELEAATGLGRGSLYAAFGDKRHLFLRSIEHYLEAAMAGPASRLQPEGGKGALIAFFREVLDAATCDRQPRGCMVTNCAVELAARDAEVAARVATHLGRLERRLLAVIAAAQAQGEIAPDREPRQLARLLVACLEGLLVLAKARSDRAWLDDAVRAVAAVL